MWSSRTSPIDITLTTVALDTITHAEHESLRVYAIEQLSLMLAHVVPTGPPQLEEKKKGLASFFRFSGRIASAFSSSATPANPPSPSIKSLAPRPASTGDAPRLFGLPLEQVCVCVCVCVCVRVFSDD